MGPGGTETSVNKDPYFQTEMVMHSGKRRLRAREPGSVSQGITEVHRPPFPCCQKHQDLRLQSSAESLRLFPNFDLQSSFPKELLTYATSPKVPMILVCISILKYHSLSLSFPLSLSVCLCVCACMCVCVHVFINWS